MERTFVMIKPDGMQRGLVGDIIGRFERCGLKIVAMKLTKASKDRVRSHYPSSEKWFKIVGQKTLKSYEEYGLDPKKDMGTDNELEIGKRVKDWLIEFISSGPVVCMVLEGNHAIDNVRRIVGNTLPIFAKPGTIRGDFSIDSADFANVKRRPIRNIVHASGDKEEAKHEINLWFKEAEIYEYKRAEEDIMFG